MAKKFADIKGIDPDIQAQLLETMISFRAEIQDSEVNARVLKRIILKYSEAEKRLFELNRTKNKFLGLAAHDLRNPLTSIRGFSELLSNGDLGPVSEDQKEFLDMIHQLSRNMLDLVNDLLDVSVIESGRLVLDTSEGALAEVVKHCVRLSRAAAEAKGMKIITHCRKIPPFPFDGARISQVVDNLISNAIKFSPHNSEISVTTESDGPKAVVRVSDQGPGLSDTDMAELFGEFCKLSARPTGEEKSTGLGLAICKRIVEAHKGTIWVENLSSGGAGFSFSLPLRP